MKTFAARLEQWSIDLLDRATAHVEADAGAWQREIDRRFTLEFDIRSKEFSLYDELSKIATFGWAHVVEIQSLHRVEFPPVMWNIVTESASWLVPDGGRYAEELTERIYALPGYHTQEVVKISPPTGYDRASSMWRKNDPYPKRNPADFEDLW